MDLTSSQGHIMGFLAHQKTAPCPKDVEEAFHLSHPTVSGLLARLEKKGFIELRTDPVDRRCKRIYVLEKGKQCQQSMRNTIEAIESRMVSDFSEEEQMLFAGFLERAITNMGGYPQHKPHKEENSK
jgi:MarR family multiple gene transcriptional regulator MgrA